MLKAVIDANVWIGAIAANGICRSVLNAFKQDLFTAIYPMYLLVELEDVLQRPKFRNKIQPEDIPMLLKLLELKAIHVSIPPEYTIPDSKDSKDNPYLACAHIAQCDFLVTGDEKHLLCLGKYKETEIITPAQFLKILKTNDKK